MFFKDNFVALIPFSKTSGLSASGIPGVVDYLIWYAKDKKKVNTEFYAEDARVLARNLMIAAKIAKRKDDYSREYKGEIN